MTVIAPRSGRKIRAELLRAAGGTRGVRVAPQGRLLEIVREAAGRIPADERTVYPDIPWLEIVGLRNRLIHGYDFVDFDILWQIVSHDVPPLISAPEKIPGSTETA